MSIFSTGRFGIHLILFLFLPSVTMTQGLNLSHATIKLESESSQSFNIPFEKIIVLDKRYDTSKIGYSYFGLEYKAIILDTDLSNCLQQYCNKKIQFGHNNKNLSIVIKSLWLQDLRLGEITKEGVLDEKQYVSQCTLKADIYSFSDNNYQALVRIDTVFESAKPRKNISSELLSSAIDQMIFKVQSLNTDQILTLKSKIKPEDVFNFYNQRFTSPRIKSDILQKCIYLTFSDFVNNHPTLVDFTVQQEKEADYLYIKENGEQKLFTDFWGFCDGSNHFIKVGYSFFPLVKDESTYSFWGCLQPIHKRKEYPRSQIIAMDIATGHMPSNSYHPSKLKNLLRPMQVDMDTGRPY